MDITHDNVCSSMLSCFYSHLLSTGRPISSISYSVFSKVFDNLSRGYPVMQKPGKVMEFYFFPGLEESWILTPFFGIFVKVMEIKGHPLVKLRCSFLLSSILMQGYIYVIRSNFGVFHSFLYCDWNLVRGSQRQNRPVSSSVQVSFMP